MERYLVISKHTLEDCKRAIEHFKQHHAGFLTHFEWGCMDNEHSAYAFIDADSHEAAKLSVPPLFRDKTNVIKVITFDPKTSEDSMHSKLK